MYMESLLASLAESFQVESINDNGGAEGMKRKNIKPPFRSSRLLLFFRRRYADQTMTNNLMYIILAERFFPALY